MRNKDTRFARHGTAVIGLNLIRGNVSSSSNGRGNPANGTRRRAGLPANGRAVARRQAV